MRDRALILAQGRGWLAIDKPAESSTHNAGAGSTAPDAVQIATRLLKESDGLRRSVVPESGFHPSPVHRLDVGTSGILLIACDRERARGLAQALESGETEKTYLGICKGVPEPAKGEWTWPLSDRAEGRRDPQGRPPHKPCRTLYRVLRTTPYFALIEARLESGRTHQIRRHTALAKHPLIGDRRYSTEAHADRINSIYGFNRLALHHSRLSFEWQGTRLSLEAPLPAEFLKLLNAINS